MPGVKQLFHRAALFFLLAFFALGTPCHGAAPAPATEHNPLLALHWQRGPTSAAIGEHATLQVPKGYAFLAPADAKTFLELNQNPVGSTHHYILAPDSLNWFVDFSFDPVGYIKDTHKINAKSVLQTVREGTVAANQQRTAHGWADLNIVGWQFPPRYDAETRRLEWAILATAGNQQIVNYNTRILGRLGVTSALLVDNPQHLNTSVAKLNMILDGFKYNPDERYSAYRPGDKVAEYGLAALITGGAAAVAFKTGLLAIIIAKLAAGWKLIVAGGAAVFGYITRLFKRSKKNKTS